MLALLLATMSAACASGGAVPRPFPAPHGPSASGRNDVIGTALSLRGVPYRNGGATPDGFDCSGFTQYVFLRHGVAIPREVRDQFQLGTSVRGEDVRAGDLLFFATTGPGPTHVAIAVDNDAFVHAPSSTGVVRVERLSGAYWSRRFLGARRLPTDNSRATN